jgi:nucleotide-binding universal stress UspA family protein
VLGTRAGSVFGVVTGIIFGLLLISAVNTAIMAMVAVKYSMAYDKELPRALLKLNYSGVPWVPLLIACGMPAVLLLVSADVKVLSELYAIGVVGAIAINVLSCAVNRQLPISSRERIGMWVLGGFRTCVEATIIVAKPHAAMFAGGMIIVVLSVRYFLHQRAKARAEAGLPEPELGWLAEVQREPMRLDPSKPRIMLAARGRYQAEYAVDMARKRGATLFTIFVRTLRVIDAGPNIVPRVEDDAAAQEALGTVVVLARQYGVPCIPIYVRSPEIVEEILDYTVTYGCDTLIMGKTRRSLFARSVSGDVVAEVARQLPEGVALITRDGSPHGGGGPGPIHEPEVVKPAAAPKAEDDQPPAT